MLLQSALALVLLDGGWEVRAQAGELYFTRDGSEVNLSEELAALAAGTVSGETWLQKWRQRGLAEVPLFRTPSAPMNARAAG